MCNGTGQAIYLYIVASEWWVSVEATGVLDSMAERQAFVATMLVSWGKELYPPRCPNVVAS